MPLGFVQELFSPAAAGGSTDAMLRGGARRDGGARSPTLTAMVAAEVHDNDDDMLGWCDSQAEFEFTLDLLLDGFARDGLER